MKNKNQIAFRIILMGAIFVTLAFIILPPIMYRINRQVETPVPDQVVRDFYNWYLSYEGNPLVDKAYRSHIALSKDFIHRLDEQTSYELIADPLLCAQDVPESIYVSSPEISGEAATVEVETSLGNRFTVRLGMEGSAWKMTGVTCQ